MVEQNIYCQGSLVILKDKDDEEYKGGIYFMDTSNTLYAAMYLQYNSGTYDNMWIYLPDQQVNGFGVIAHNPALGADAITCQMSNVGLWSLGVTTYSPKSNWTAISADHSGGPENPGDTICVINCTASGVDDYFYGNIINTLGQDISACNYGYFSFNFIESESPYNELALGYCDQYNTRYDAQKIDMAGNITFNGGLMYMDNENQRIGLNKNPAYLLDIAGDCNLSTGGKFRINGVDIMNNTITDLTPITLDKVNNRVGIDKTNPAYPLDVTGDVNTTTTYKIGGNDVLTSSTLGSSVTSSSLTSVGTLSTLTATGTTILGTSGGSAVQMLGEVKMSRVAWVDPQYGSSFALKLSGGAAFDYVNVKTGNAYKINNTDILSATTLGSSVVNSSLTSVGTLSNLTVSGDIMGNYNTTTGFRINGVYVLYSGNLGSGIVNSSLTKVGTLTNLTVAGDVTVDTDTLKVDSSNNRVGIINASPGYPLDVVGDVNTSTKYKIGGADVLTSTTLGSTVLNSSLTSVGTLSSLAVTGDVTIDSTTLKVDSTNNRVGIKNASPAYTLDVNGDTNIVGNLTVSGGISGTTPYDSYTRTTTLSLPYVTPTLVTFDQTNVANTGLTYSSGKFTNVSGRSRMFQFAWRGSSTASGNNHTVSNNLYLNGTVVPYYSGGVAATTFTVIGSQLLLLNNNDYVEQKLHSSSIANTTLQEGYLMMITAFG